MHFSYVCKKNIGMENKFKVRLRDLREEKGVGQVELAQALGVSKGIISLWENGLREPKMSALIAIAEYFGISIDYLVGLKDF